MPCTSLAVVSGGIAVLLVRIRLHKIDAIKGIEVARLAEESIDIRIDITNDTTIRVSGTASAMASRLNTVASGDSRVVASVTSIRKGLIVPVRLAVPRFRN